MDICAVVLSTRIAIFKTCHHKVRFHARKREKFKPSRWRRKNLIFKMQNSRTFLFQLCLSLVVSTGSCTCKPLSNDIQVEDPVGYYSLQSRDDLLEEEDTDSRMENLLGTMKEDFLRKLNLSDIPQEHNKISPPQFMMELYNKYVSDSAAIPQSDVIRSFTVQGMLFNTSCMLLVGGRYSPANDHT